MVEKELWMYVIAYNLIRALSAEAVLKYAREAERVSFKGAVSTLRQWAPILANHNLSPDRRLAIYDVMLYYLTRDKLPYRPGRVEPRAKKRRPKNYQVLNKPRGEFREIQHRNRYKKA